MLVSHALRAVAALGFILLAIDFARAADKAPTPAIVPLPVELKVLDGTFELTAATTIVADEASRETAKQLAEDLQPATGFTLKIVPAKDGGSENVIRLTEDKSLEKLGPEGYRLTVAPKRIEITAPTQTGVFYGVQTLRQLFPTEIFSPKKVDGVAWKATCVKIEDYPRFAWRGLMYDSGHDFQTLPFIYKLIDLMAVHKINVFHWHLPDLGTWPIEIKKYPKLLDASTRADGVKPGHYTQDEIRQVVKYAADRHITIVPEIDMPGHSTPALLAYPELNCPIPEPGRPWQYCVSNEKTYEFLQDVLSEVIDLFPSKFIHIGGDECPKERWMNCPNCQAKMKAEDLKDGNELQSYFIKRIEKFINSKGRRLIGWDEILEGGLAPKAAVMSWRGVEGGIMAAKAGHDVVMAAGTHLYFDHPQTIDNATDPYAHSDATITLEMVYSFEPIPKDFTPEEAKHILGAQAQSWSDTHPTEASIEWMVYPRSCALSEITWSPAAARDYYAFFQRMLVHEKRLKEMSVNSRPLNTIPQPKDPS